MISKVPIIEVKEVIALYEASLITAVEARKLLGLKKSST